MALSEQLVLDTRRAFAQLDELQSTLTAIGRIDISPTVDIPTGPADSLSQSFSEAEQAANNLAVATGQVADTSRLADTNVSQLAQALGVSEAEASQMASAVLTARNRSIELEGAARDVAQQLGLAEADARDFAQQMGRATRETRDTGDAADRLVGGFRTIRNLLVGGVAALGLTVGVSQLVDQFNRAIDASTNLSESTNAVNVVFEEGTQTVTAFAQAASTAAGLATAEAQQLVVPIGSLLRNFGFDAQEAADQTVILTQRAADLASVFNSDVGEALGAIQAALRGEADPLERFGASISAARVESLLLAEGLADSASEITDQQKVYGRLQLILADTARVAGDFANTSDSIANRQRIAAAEAENLRAELGDELLPVMESLLDVAPVLVQALRDMAPAIGDLAEQAAEAAPGLAEFVGGIPRAVEQLADSLRILGALGGVFGEAADETNRFFDGLLRFALEGGVLEGLLDEPTEDVRQFGDAFDDLQVARAIQTINNSIALGLPNLDAFGVVVADVGQNATLTADDIEALAAAADLEDLSIGELQTLISGFDNLRGSIGDINVDTVIASLRRLQLEAALPTETLQRGFAIDTAAMEAAFAIDGVTAATTAALTPFQELAQVAEASERSFTELAFGAAELSPALEDAATSGEAWAEILREIQSDADAAATVISSTLGDAITSASSAFVDANENNRVSAAEFLEGLVDTATTTADFEANLLDLAARFPALAETLRTAGADVAGDAAADFAENFDLAGQAEAVLQGDIPGTAATISDFADQAVELSNTDPAALAFWEAFAQSLQTPGFAAGVQDAVNAVLGSLSGAVPIVPTAASGAKLAGRGGETVSGLGGVAQGGVNVVINNPVTEDLSSSAAQAGQIIGSVGGLLTPQ